MKPFTIHRGTTVALMDDNINTDQILPSTFLSRIEKKGFGQFLFFNWRYIANNNQKPNPEFPLNYPEHKGASILITGDNFAGGSSREHAVWALDDYGFRVVIAGSFSDIFYMNSLKNGLLALTLPLEERQILANLPSDEAIEVNLEDQTITTAHHHFTFSIDEEWRHKLLGGIDDITETLEHLDAIKAYEDKWNDFYQTNDQVNALT